MKKIVQLLFNLVRDKQYRRGIAVAIMILSAAFVVHFFAVHPEYITRLRHVPPHVVLLVILLNIPSTAALVWANDAILRLCGKPLAIKENMLLTIYSSLVNFFGPFQSGPGVRAVYLKTRHQVRVRDYLVAMLTYYLFYASFAGLFLMVGVRPWWQTVIVVSAIAGFSYIVVGYVAQRRPKTQDETPSLFAWRPRVLALLAAAVFLQLCTFVAYYYVELHAVNPHTSLAQTISYTGGASFATFVSITPDAVGLREAFLVFSQSLHHVSTADILSANVIDRGAYLLYLLILVPITLIFHLRSRLGFRQKEEMTDKR